LSCCEQNIPVETRKSSYTLANMLSSMALDPKRILMSRWGNLLAYFAGFFVLSLALCTVLGSPSSSNIYDPSADYLSHTPQDGKATIIIPAYHEADSIEPLINKLTTKLDHDQTEIIVVDDNSRDGTVDVVQEFFEDGFDVNIITRTNKSGLSSAVIDGMALAKGDILLVMDADGQHPPDAAAALLRSLRDTPDALMAMGVREKLASEWPWYRRVMSWGATMLATPLVGSNVHDPMTGLFAIRAEVFRNSRPVNTSGFKIALELLLKSILVQNNWESDVEDRVIEVPYTFEARKSGASKLGCKVVIQYAVQLFGLYYWRLGMLLPIGIAVLATLATYTLLSAYHSIRGSIRYERIRRMSGDMTDDEESRGMLAEAEKYED